MVIHRLLRVVAVLLTMFVGAAFTLPVGVAHATGSGGGKDSATNSSKSVSPGKKGKRVGKYVKRRRGRGKFSGRLASAAELRVEPLAKPSGRISLKSLNLHEEVDVNIYAEDGTFDQAALAKLDRLFRCKRTGEERAIDPRLYEILSIIHDKYGKTIELNSGFRYQRNEGSRHFHGSAMDIQIPGVSMQQLYTYAQSLDAGGMGIGKYPYSGFVHIDFRAPGEASYRWSDTQRNNRKADMGKAPSKMWKRSTRPNT